MSDAPSIEYNRGGRVEQRVACPKCDRSARDTALGVNTETGVFHCFRCGWKGRVDGRHSDTASTRITSIADPSVAERKRRRLRQTWAESVPLYLPQARSVRTYLASRALDEILRHPPAALRAHQGLEYWDLDQCLGVFPAMVALFHGASGQPVTLHVTYLRSDGCAKAPVPSPKKILGVAVKGTTRGGAIHLYEPRAGVLGVAEGIESALSLHLLQNVPVWAAFSAGNLAVLKLPNGVRELQIGVDLDCNGKGEEAARRLVRRVMQDTARTNARTDIFYVKPGLTGPCDLNDELRKRRVSCPS